MINEETELRILKIERAIDNEQKNKLRYAMLTGAFFIGSGVLLKFNPNESQILMDEISSIYSWDAFISYFDDLGPAVCTTILGGFASAVKSIKAHNNIKEYKSDLNDLNSLNVEEKGKAYVKRM